MSAFFILSKSCLIPKCLPFEYPLLPPFEGGLGWVWGELEGGDSYVLEERIGLIVHHQFLGEGCLLKQRQRILIVGNGVADVCVAAQDDGHIVALTQAQDFQIFGRSLRFVAHGVEAAGIDFEQRMRIACRQHDGFEEEVRRTVARMRDDLHPRILDGGNHTIGVLLGRASLPTEFVDAGNAEVQAVAVVVIVEIQCAVMVQDVQFGPQEQAHAVHQARHNVEVAEIDGVARAGNAWRMFRDSEYLQSLFAGRGSHLLNGAVGVSASQGVCMYVE